MAFDAKNIFKESKPKTNALKMALIQRKTGKHPGVSETFTKSSGYGAPKFQKGPETIANKE